MLDSLLTLVNLLTTYDPTKITTNIQEFHQLLIAPDDRREASRTDFPLLKPTLLAYIQTSQTICNCRYDANCLKTQTAAVIPIAAKFKSLTSTIIPSMLTSTQETNYDALAALVPQMSQVPLLCVQSQDPSVHIESYYKEPQLDFFLKELYSSAQNICACGDSDFCYSKTKVILDTIYENLDTSKINNLYAKSMWLTYDAISRICLATPDKSNVNIAIPAPLPISETILKQPTLTPEQAKAYVGYEVIITRNDGRVQTGILLAINENILTISIHQFEGYENDYVPLNTIATIKAAQAKDDS